MLITAQGAWNALPAWEESVKPSLALRLALCALAAALLAAAGCAYTTVTAKERPHLPLPPVKAGLQAVMGPVNDKRIWQISGQDNPLPDVRLFTPEITAHMRKGLMESGLFTALPGPDEAAAKEIKAGLSLELTQFGLTRLGSNAWVVPHLLLDGVALPVFTGMAIYSKGRVDLGSYLMPSSRMGTQVTVRLAYGEGQAVLLEKEYSVQEELGEVSERKYLETINDTSSHGVEMGRREGRKALDSLVRAIAGDPLWQNLPLLRRLVEAENLVKQGKPLPVQAAVVQDLLAQLPPSLTYLEDEVKVLRDGYLDAKSRAGIVNDLRVRWLVLDDIKQLPAGQTISEEGAEQLFDDPALPKHQAEAVIAERILHLALSIIMAPEQRPGPPLTAAAATLVVPPVGFRGPAAGVAPELSPGLPRPLAPLPSSPATASAQAGVASPSPLAPAQAKVLRQQLSRDLVARVRADLRLQVQLVLQAEKAVGPDWAPMEGLLRQVGTPYINKYLNTRKG